MAILVSLRHDPATLDVSSVGGQWSREDICNRGLTFRGFGYNQCNRYI